MELQQAHAALQRRYTKAKVHLMQARMTLHNYGVAQQADNDLFSSAAVLGNASTDLGVFSCYHAVYPDTRKRASALRTGHTQQGPGIFKIVQWNAEQRKCFVHGPTFLVHGPPGSRQSLTIQGLSQIQPAPQAVRLSHHISPQTLQETQLPWPWPHGSWHRHRPT
jgi:hypothetical protein